MKKKTVFSSNITQITKKWLRLEDSKWPFEQLKVEANLSVF